MNQLPAKELYQQARKKEKQLIVSHLFLPIYITALAAFRPQIGPSVWPDWAVFLAVTPIFGFLLFFFLRGMKVGEQKRAAWACYGADEEEYY